MECREIRSLADPYLSEQLLVETTQGIVQHIERCPPCRADIEGRRRLRDALRVAFEGAPDLQPRSEFLQSLTARLRSEVPSLQRHSPWRWWLAIAASVVAVVTLGASGAVWLAQAGLSELRHLAAGDHQNCALKFTLPERPITLAEASAEFDLAFGGLETVRLPAQSSSGDEIRFLERHACVFQGQPFAHIVVRYKGARVSLLVADEVGSRTVWRQGAAPREMPPSWGFNVASFRGAGRSVFVVSGLPASDVQELARAVVEPITRALEG